MGVVRGDTSIAVQICGIGVGDLLPDTGDVVQQRLGVLATDQSVSVKVHLLHVRLRNQSLSVDGPGNIPMQGVCLGVHIGIAIFFKPALGEQIRIKAILLFHIRQIM